MHRGGVRCHFLGVRFPLSVLDTVGTATKLVEHHRDRARVHVIVPVEAAKRIERAITSSRRRLNRSARRARSPFHEPLVRVFEGPSLGPRFRFEVS
jgi:hypothetical protein